MCRQDINAQPNFLIFHFAIFSQIFSWNDEFFTILFFTDQSFTRYSYKYLYIISIFCKRHALIVEDVASVFKP